MKEEISNNIKAIILIVFGFFNLYLFNFSPYANQFIFPSELQGFYRVFIVLGPWFGAWGETHQSNLRKFWHTNEVQQSEGVEKS